MERYFYHPLGKENYKNPPFTQPGHGIGKLDISGANMPLYSMTDGVCQENAIWSDGSCLSIQVASYDTAITSPIYIRYIHGRYLVNIGDKVTKGQLIGYSDTIGTNNYHLHIDMSWVPNDFYPVYGTLNEDKTIYTVKNKQYHIDPDQIDWNLVNAWKTKNGGPADAWGYMWLIMASKGRLITEPEIDSSSIVAAAKKVIMAYYKNAMENYGTTTGYYNQSLSATLKIDGKTVRSRRDCSGYIDAIFQYLNDADSSYQANTSGLVSYPPKNWKVYKTTEVTPQIGDVVVRNQGNGDHTEIIVNIKNGIYYSYGFGGDYELEQCGKNGTPIPLYNGINFYNYILRRTK